jgi:KTSC domain
VPQDVADAFKAAFSRGAFFNREIRDRYSYREVTGEHAAG